MQAGLTAAACLVAVAPRVKGQSTTSAMSSNTM
jgi:hypothetical protein